MIFDIDLDKIPDEALPAIHELPDDLRLMAEIIGDVRLVLKVAMAFRGTPIRTGGTKTILIGIRIFSSAAGATPAIPFVPGTPVEPGRTQYQQDPQPA